MCKTLTGSNSGNAVIAENGSLILNRVNSGDTAVYQCQASNKHGTILTNTHVYVIGEYLALLFVTSSVFSVCASLCLPHMQK